jgi:hypothetical protein
VVTGVNEDEETALGRGGAELREGRFWTLFVRALSAGAWLRDGRLVALSGGVAVLPSFAGAGFDEGIVVVWAGDGFTGSTCVDGVFWLNPQ